jgi:hypothetical protein
MRITLCESLSRGPTWQDHDTVRPRVCGARGLCRRATVRYLVQPLIEPHPTMPLQNRVTPTGEIVATSHRGTMMGIRGGCFHDDHRTLKRRQWASKRWICCVLSYKGRRRELMRPGHYTELFFLDEATAFAAGHRPCFECRRPAALRYQSLWTQSIGRGVTPRAGDMDDILHAERMADRHKRPKRQLADVPDRAMVEIEGAPFLWSEVTLRPWSFAGYGPPRVAPAHSTVTVITPPATLAILTAGYQPMLHATALASK